MQTKQFLLAMNDIDDRYILSSDVFHDSILRQSRRSRFFDIAIPAFACVCILALAWVLVQANLIGVDRPGAGGDSPGSSLSEVEPLPSPPSPEVDEPATSDAEDGVRAPELTVAIQDDGTLSYDEETGTYRKIYEVIRHKLLSSSETVLPEDEDGAVCTGVLKLPLFKVLASGKLSQTERNLCALCILNYSFWEKDGVSYIRSEVEYEDLARVDLTEIGSGTEKRELRLAENGDADLLSLAMTMEGGTLGNMTVEEIMLAREAWKNQARDLGRQLLYRYLYSHNMNDMYLQETDMYGVASLQPIGPAEDAFPKPFMHNNGVISYSDETYQMLHDVIAEYYGGSRGAYHTIYRLDNNMTLPIALPLLVHTCKDRYIVAVCYGSYWLNYEDENVVATHGDVDIVAFGKDGEYFSNLCQRGDSRETISQRIREYFEDDGTLFSDSVIDLLLQKVEDWGPRGRGMADELLMNYLLLQSEVQWSLGGLSEMYWEGTKTLTLVDLADLLNGGAQSIAAELQCYRHQHVGFGRDIWCFDIPDGFVLDFFPDTGEITLAYVLSTGQTASVDLRRESMEDLLKQVDEDVSKAAGLPSRAEINNLYLDEEGSLRKVGLAAKDAAVDYIEQFISDCAGNGSPLEECYADDVRIYSYSVTGDRFLAYFRLLFRPEDPYAEDAYWQDENCKSAMGMYPDSGEDWYRTSRMAEIVRSGNGWAVKQYTTQRIVFEEGGCYMNKPLKGILSKEEEVMELPAPKGTPRPTL